MRFPGDGDHKMSEMRMAGVLAVFCDVASAQAVLGEWSRMGGSSVSEQRRLADVFFSCDLRSAFLAEKAKTRRVFARWSKTGTHLFDTKTGNDPWILK